MKRISILPVALLAIVVSACTGEQASSSASPSEPAATESASEEPTVEPSESEAAEESLGAIPSFDLNGDPELAARFPDTVGGEPLQVQSFGGETFVQMGGADPSFEAFLESIGADVSDVSVAFGASASAESPLTAIAFRIVGASEEELEREFIAVTEESADAPGLTQTSVGGKDVWSAAVPDGAAAGMSIFIYTKDDTLYLLTGSEEQVAEILTALP